jgi:hypothetical protein
MSGRPAILLPLALAACSATSPSPRVNEERGTAADTVIVSPELEVAESAQGPTPLLDEVAPDVVGSGDGGLSVWKAYDHVTFQERVEAVRLDADGRPVGDKLLVRSLADSAFGPFVAFGGDVYRTFLDEPDGIRLIRIARDGTILDSDPEPLLPFSELRDVACRTDGSCALLIGNELRYVGADGVASSSSISDPDREIVALVAAGDGYRVLMREGEYTTFDLAVVDPDVSEPLVPVELPFIPPSERRHLAGMDDGSVVVTWCGDDGGSYFAVFAGTGEVVRPAEYLDISCVDTPVVAGGKLFVHVFYGDVHEVDLATGEAREFVIPSLYEPQFIAGAALSQRTLAWTGSTWPDYEPSSEVIIRTVHTDVAGVVDEELLSTAEAPRERPRVDAGAADHAIGWIETRGRWELPEARVRFFDGVGDPVAGSVRLGSTSSLWAVERGESSYLVGWSSVDAEGAPVNLARRFTPQGAAIGDAPILLPPWYYVTAAAVDGGFAMAAMDGDGLRVALLADDAVAVSNDVLLGPGVYRSDMARRGDELWLVGRDPQGGRFWRLGASGEVLEGPVAVDPRAGDLTCSDDRCFVRLLYGSYDDYLEILPDGTMTDGFSASWDELAIWDGVSFLVAGVAGPVWPGPLQGRWLEPTAMSVVAGPIELAPAVDWPASWGYGLAARGAGRSIVVHADRQMRLHGFLVDSEVTGEGGGGGGGGSASGAGGEAGSTTDAVAASTSSTGDGGAGGAGDGGAGGVAGGGGDLATGSGSGGSPEEGTGGAGGATAQTTGAASTGVTSGSGAAVTTTSAGAGGAPASSASAVATTAGPGSGGADANTPGGDVAEDDGCQLAAGPPCGNLAPVALALVVLAARRRRDRHAGA